MSWVEGFALAVGACGMWKEKEDGGRVWITCRDRRGRAAWRRVAGEEAAMQTRSEGFNLERKAEIGEMWLLVRGRGRGGRYFRGSRKFGIASAKKLACKVSSDTVPNSERVVDCSRRTFSRKPYAYYNPTVVQDILCCISHGW